LSSARRANSSWISSALRVLLRRIGRLTERGRRHGPWHVQGWQLRQAATCSCSCPPPIREVPRVLANDAPVVRHARGSGRARPTPVATEYDIRAARRRPAARTQGTQQTASGLRRSRHRVRHCAHEAATAPPARTSGEVQSNRDLPGSLSGRRTSACDVPGMHGCLRACRR